MIADDTKLSMNLAQIGYEAYGDFRNWKTHDGKPMPQWNDLTLVIKEAWQRATIAIVEGFESSQNM